MFQPGLRYFDPKLGWQIGAPPYRPTHALLLLHGILSCAEKTFNQSTLVSLYRQDGGYDYILGYDYDWLQNPSTIAPQIAAAVNGLGLSYAINGTTYGKLDVFAHSYGTINAMATITMLNTRVDNAVFYDGPLDGALIADPRVFASLITDAEAISFAGGAASITPNLVALLQQDTAIYRSGAGSQLQSIESAFESSGKAARVIKLTGGTALPLYCQNPSACTTLATIYTRVTGITPPQNDGVVTGESGLYSGITGVQPPATLDPNDTVNAVTADYLLPSADHITILSAITDPDSGSGQTFQQVTEGLMAQYLSFAFDNSSSTTGVYPSSGGGVVMKGIGSRAHFYPMETPQSGVCYSYLAQVVGYAAYSNASLTYQPSSVPMSQCQSDAGPITFTETGEPTTALAVSSGQVEPLCVNLG